ncbi:acetylornithine deacetylase [Polaromonas sp. YR568]|uniref:acetylornithine deacetylase n=1 Tax=Polaromonas sp. YR568 TaxID=1855301 RepID=UPI00398BD0C7
MNKKPSSPKREPTSQTVSIVKTLVAFDTVSRNSNLPLIDWISDYLLKHGVKSRLTFDEGRKKANLFATLGSGTSGGLILSGHTDTVPVDGQKWKTAPFEAIVSDANIYGRGAADMKGFIGVCLAAVPKILAADIDSPVHLALTFDEETSMLGVRSLIADLRDADIQPHGCIIGEPTSMRAVIGHKGRRHLSCSVRGKAAHSSLAPQGVNAIEHAAKIIVYLKGMADRHKAFEQRHYGYDVPYSTIQTNMTQGGLSANTVPAECTFDFDIRNLPWTDVDSLEAEIRAFAKDHVLPEMRKDFAESAITFKTESELPAFGAASPEEGLNEGTSKLLSRMRRKDTPLSYVGFGTEASWFQDAGIPTVVCGPGSIEQAHKPDEYVSLDQLAQCESFIAELLLG